MSRRIDMGRTGISDLPLSAVKLISQYARGRLIAGANKYASVSRQWRDADSSSEQLEPLQLFVDLRHMSEADVARAFSWMAAHGQQVDVLVLGGRAWQELPPDLFSKAAASLTNLTWLEVQLRHSLVLLAPVLDQLPQLQHLGAAVDVGQDPEGTRWEDDNLEHDEDEPDVVMFLDEEGNAWWDVPYLGQLCPQLTSIHLRLDRPGSFVLLDHDDGRSLGTLLPTKLKQLTLRTEVEQEVMLDAIDLVNLTALEQLTLDGIQVASFTHAGPVTYGAPEVTGPAVLAQQLTALQQLRWYDRAHGDKHADAVRPLAPKLTGYRQLGSQGVRVIQHMPHLTQLKLGLTPKTRPQAITQALAALTGLQELSLEGHFSFNLGDVLQQVAGMASLRSLELEGSLDHDWAREVGAALQKCTQLTSLVPLVKVHPDFDSEFDEEPYWLHVPHELTGLRCLTVQWDGSRRSLGVWPAYFTQLTSLCVRLEHDCISQLPWEPMPLWMLDYETMRQHKEYEEDEDEESEGAVERNIQECALWEALMLGLPLTQQQQQQLSAQRPPQPVQQQQQPTPTYESIAKELLQQVDQWPPSLKQVLFQVVGRPLEKRDQGVKPALWHFTPAAAPAGAQPISVWLEEKDGAAPDWARPMQPCPHLPGAWELQGRAQGSYCSKWVKW